MHPCKCHPSYFAVYVLVDPGEGVGGHFQGDAVFWRSCEF